MRQFTTIIFIIMFIATFWTTLGLGITWLFNYYPKNLYNFWLVCCKVFAVSLLFYILFGGRKTT